MISGDRPSRPRCPFYGMSMPGGAVMIDQSGNQCALISGSHAPCQMEMAELAPVWTECVFYYDPERVVMLEATGMRVISPELRAEAPNGVSLARWANYVMGDAPPC